MDGLARTVQQALTTTCGLGKGARVVVGVSGGADSMVLLDALHRAGYDVVAAHYHHGLRPEADADAHAVETFAARLHVPCILQRGDIRALARQTRRPLEEAAREARYQFLFRSARQHQAKAVVVGHTADDQAETVLMHLLRGSGLRGLAGLRPCRVLPAWDAEIPLARPLLAVPRSEIMRYARAHALPIRWDASNWQRDFFRNRVRLDILPRLRTENPAIDAALGRLAAIAAAEDDFIAAEAARRWTEVLATAGEGFIALRRAPLLTAHLALQRRWLQQAADALAQVPSGLAHIEAAREAAQRPGGPPRPWFGGLMLWSEPRHLWLARADAELPAAAWPQMPPPRQPHPLHPGAAIPLEAGWALHLSAPTAPPDDWRARANAAHIWLDADALTFPLIVRPRRPGDRIAPLGMNGRHRKLSDLMIDAKIPPRLRGRWPVVLSGSEVIWVPLLSLSHTARLTNATRRVVSLTLTSPQEVF